MNISEKKLLSWESKVSGDEKRNPTRLLADSIGSQLEELVVPGKKLSAECVWQALPEDCSSNQKQAVLDILNSYWKHSRSLPFTSIKKLEHAASMAETERGRPQPRKQPLRLIPMAMCSPSFR